MATLENVLNPRDGLVLTSNGLVDRTENKLIERVMSAFAKQCVEFTHSLEEWKSRK